MSLHALKHFLHLYWPVVRGRGRGWEVERENKVLGSNESVEVGGQGGVGKRLKIVWRAGGRECWKEQGRRQRGDRRVANHRGLHLPAHLRGWSGLERGWGAGGSPQVLRDGLDWGTGSSSALDTCRRLVATTGLPTSPAAPGSSGGRGRWEGRTSRGFLQSPNLLYS